MSGSGSDVITLDSEATLLRRSLDVADWRAKLCRVVDDPLSKADYDRYLSDLTANRTPDRTALGLAEFEGRSYPGRHHHMTLMPAAYAFARLTATGTDSRAA